MDAGQALEDKTMRCVLPARALAPQDTGDTSVTGFPASFYTKAQSRGNLAAEDLALSIHTMHVGTCIVGRVFQLKVAFS